MVSLPLDDSTDWAGARGLAAWKLSNLQLLTQTRTSHLYTVTHSSETVVLKLLAPAETEEQRGAVALRYFGGHGAVRLLRHDEVAQLIGGRWRRGSHASLVRVC